MEREEKGRSLLCVMALYVVWTLETLLRHVQHMASMSSGAMVRQNPEITYRGCGVLFSWMVLIM